MSSFRKNLVVLFFALFLALPVSAIEYGGVGGRPAYPQPGNPRSDSIFIHTLEPGTEQKEGVRIINNTKEIKTLIVYASDSTPSTGGAFACEQFSETKDDVGAWITMSKKEVTLEPATNVVVPFVINVPVNADVWEHNGCILVQEKKIQTNEAQAWVNLSMRTGTRVALTIPGELHRKLEIVWFDIKRSPGVFILHPQVKNTGNVSIDAHVTVETRYLLGFLHKVHGGDYPILRGEVSDWNFELGRPFWGGLYRSRFAVEYDEDSTAIVGVESGKKLTRLVSPSVWFFSFPTIPWLIVELLILCFLGVLGYVFALSQKRKKWIAETWVTYTVKGWEDINSLASEFNVSWKLLARVNHLQPPYVLKKNAEIKVPPQD